MFNHKYRVMLLLIWLLVYPLPVAAQTVTSAILSPPDTEDFPVFRSYLEVYDEGGNFIHDLQAEDVTIVEDQEQIPVTDLEEMEIGAQFVVALNLGSTFAIRDSNGISRNDNLQAALHIWGLNHSTNLDDLSFLTNDGPETIHLTTGEQWLDGLYAYGTDPRSAIASLDVLFRAVEVASDPVPRVGMGRAVLLLTPPPDRTSSATLQSIIALAKQERVRIYIWMVSSPAYFSSQTAVQLSDLATQTGGQFFAYSGVEIFPDIEEYLEPLRYVYSLSYESGIRNSEPHQIYAQITSNGQSATSETQDFNFQVVPPNPIFLSPPIQIFRANTSALANTLSEESDYTPKEQTLDILIEYPDKLPRPLVRTTLYVDGKIADENSSPPFDQFTWDLRAYTASGNHILQVEVLDSLGLSNISIDNAVQITVQQTPQSVISTIADNIPIIAGAAVALAGGILLLVLILGGHIQPKNFGGRRKKTSKPKKQGSKDRDPVTQSVPIEGMPSSQRIPKWINHLSWPQRNSASEPLAYLEPLVETDKNHPRERLPISAGEITFGKDPTQATISFNDSALDDLHARLIVNGEGDYRLYDEGSIAGTWVNFAPISSEGAKLSHGDIIHLGRISLLFRVSDKKQIPKPIVIPQEPRS
jgi:hypothetical protein